MFEDCRHRLYAKITERYRLGFAEIAETNLNALMEENQNKNTTHVFNEWRLARKQQNGQKAFEDIPVGELEAVLSIFYAEVRKI